VTDTEPPLSLPRPRGLRGVLSGCGPSGSAASEPLAVLAGASGGFGGLQRGPESRPQAEPR